jgi:hypothetical protein
MDPAVSVAMILLSCSPDMLLCRQARTQPTTIYAGIAECTAALPGRPAGTSMVGKCQPLHDAATVPRWSIAPGGEVVTFEAPQPRVPSAGVDARVTGSIAPANAPARRDPTTIRVTRGTGPDAVSTDYLVPRAIEESQ